MTLGRLGGASGIGSEVILLEPGFDAGARVMTEGEKADRHHTSDWMRKQ